MGDQNGATGVAVTPEKPKYPPGVYARKGTKFLWVVYWHRGRSFRESARTTNPKEAAKFRTKRLGELHAGVYTSAQQEKVTVARILDAYLENRKLAGRRGLRHIEGQCRRLKAQLGFLQACEVTLPKLEKWANDQIAAGAARASVKVALAYLHSAFTIARRLQLITHRPDFPSIHVDNARQGFFEKHQFEAVRAQLLQARRHGQVLADVATFACFSGWRLREVIEMPWTEVDRDRGEVTLAASRSKNGRPRTLPLVGELTEVIERRWQARVVGKVMISPWVFHRAGKPVRNIYGAWRTACAAAGVHERKPHDFRRTCVRDLINSGVAERVAMSITGHQTRAMFDRYHIVTSEDQRRALELASSKRAASNVIKLPVPAGAR